METLGPRTTTIEGANQLTKANTPYVMPAVVNPSTLNIVSLFSAVIFSAEANTKA